MFVAGLEEITCGRHSEADVGSRGKRTSNDGRLQKIEGSLFGFLGGQGIGWLRGLRKMKSRVADMTGQDRGSRLSTDHGQSRKTQERRGQV